MHPTFPLEGMGDEVPRNRRQPDLGTRRQMSNLRVEGGRVASSTVNSFTQMASKQWEQWPALDKCKVRSQPAQREVGRGFGEWMNKYAVSLGHYRLQKQFGTTPTCLGPHPKRSIT